jgi:hypothetical protein
MKPMFGRAFRFVVLVLLLASAAHAMDLKVRPWPLSDTAYAPIDAASVRVELYISEAAWLAQVGGTNGVLALDLSLTRVASIDIYRLYDEESIDSTAPLIEEARRNAAKVGANLVYLERNLMRGRELDGLRFVAYRAEFKHRLISPLYLAALPHLAVTPAFLNEQLVAWQASHLGRVSITVGGLSGVKRGTAVRLVLRDGTDVRGAFSSVDEENQIWIHPAGLIGFFRDRAVPAKDVQSVALLK